MGQIGKEKHTILLKKEKTRKLQYIAYKDHISTCQRSHRLKETAYFKSYHWNFPHFTTTETAEDERCPNAW